MSKIKMQHKEHTFKVPLFVVKRCENEAKRLGISYKDYFLSYMTYTFIISFNKNKDDVERFICSRITMYGGTK